MMRQNQSSIHNSSHILMSLLWRNIKVDISNQSTQSSTHRACHVVKELLLLHVDNTDWKRSGVPWQSVFEISLQKSDDIYSI